MKKFSSYIWSGRFDYKEVSAIYEFLTKTSSTQKYNPFPFQEKNSVAQKKYDYVIKKVDESAKNQNVSHSVGAMAE